MQRRSFIKNFAASLFIASCAPAVAQKNHCLAVEANVADIKFKPGQVWSYQTRPGEPESTITILQIDRMEKIGIVISVRVDGLEAHNPRGERVPAVEHMPFTRDAMLLSVDHLLRTEGQLPVSEGYDNWHSACGGVYTISVADAVAVMEKTLNQGSAR
jgi:hypothetical protein